MASISPKDQLEQEFQDNLSRNRSKVHWATAAAEICLKHGNLEGYEDYMAKAEDHLIRMCINMCQLASL